MTNTVGIGIKSACFILRTGPCFFLMVLTIGYVSNAAIRVAAVPKIISSGEPPIIFVIKHPMTTPKIPAGV